MQFITSVFSMNMLESPQIGHQFKIYAWKISAESAKDFVESEAPKSVIPNAAFATIISADLDVDVLCNRETVKLRGGDTMLLCQYSGPRLQSGASELPNGAQIDYFVLEIA